MDDRGKEFDPGSEEIITNVGDGLSVDNANWSFQGEVSKSFDDHVRRSIPFYKEGHVLACHLSDFFIKQDSVCYEIGCSTGELLIKLAQHNANKPHSKYIGYDVEPDMVDLAQKKIKKYEINNAEALTENILQVDFESSDMIVAYYLVQFIRPSERQRLIEKIYASLNWGGAFLMFEKVRGADARFQDIMTSLYTDFKLEQGYKPDEIMAKTRSLKGVLEPFSTQGNLDMLKRAGFVDIVSVLKYVCFEGFLAIK